MKFDGTLEYVVKKEKGERTKRVFKEGIGWHYVNVEYQYDKAVWRISGALPAIMVSRIIPDAWSGDKGVVEIHDNPPNIEHLDWIMMRYRLDVKNPKIWQERVKSLQKRVDQRAKLEQLEKLVEPPMFKGRLYDFQKECVDFIKKTDGSCLVADEMGTGKTIEAIAYLASEGNSAFPCLVVAPLVTLQNWRREIQKFLQVNRKGGADGQYAEPKIVTIREGKPGNLPSADIYITNYDLVHKRKEDYIRAKVKTFVLDEIQNLRSDHTQKYQACLEIANGGTVTHRLGLSGTPMYNRGIEMYHIINFINPGLLGEMREFQNLWCGYDGLSIADSKRDALAQLLRQNVMIRRRKADVLKELPDKTIHRQKIDVDMQYYESEMEKAIDKLHERLTTGAANTDLTSISQAYSDFAEQERQTAGIAKIPFVCDFIENMLEIEEPVVVFAYHHAVIDRLRDRLTKYSPVFITGRESDKQKWAAEDDFQTGRTNLIVCGLRAGNLGINLFRAHCVVFAEFDWSPSIHKQAEDRLHRNGQKNAVFAYYLEGAKTFDEIMVKVLVEKKMEIDSVMGDATAEASSRVDKESMTKLMIASFNERLALAGKKIDITMPDKERIRAQKKEIDRLTKKAQRERLKQPRDMIDDEYDDTVTADELAAKQEGKILEQEESLKEIDDIVLEEEEQVIRRAPSTALSQPAS